MPRRKQLKNIAYGLLSSFISRNNDVNGYWGIGKLFALMENSANYCIQIDLISKSMIPADDEFERLIDEFSNKLQRHLKSVDFSHEHLAEARIILTGYSNEHNMLSEPTALHRVNCLFKLTDDVGTTHSAEKNIWCRRHNPNLESKSTRQY